MLKIKWLVLIFLFLFSFTAFAIDSKPTDASLKELLTVTQSQKLLDSMMGQFDGLMRSMAQQVFKGQTVTPEQQKVFDNMQKKMIMIFREEMNWIKLEPMYLQIYRDSFTQQEVDGMLAFYKTPAGQAVIKKVPVVMQNTFTEMQNRMGPIMQKLQKMQQETIAEIKEQAATQQSQGKKEN